GDVEGVVGPVEVEARHLDQRHLGHQVRVGLAAEHLDVVPEPRQLLAQVVRVDTLAARVWVAAVNEQGNAQRVPHRKGSACREIDRSVKRGRSRRLAGRGEAPGEGAPGASGERQISWCWPWRLWPPAPHCWRRWPPSEAWRPRRRGCSR